MTFTTALALAMFIIGFFMATIWFFKSARELAHATVDRWAIDKFSSTIFGVCALVSFLIGMFGAWVILRGLVFFLSGGGTFTL